MKCKMSQPHIFHICTESAWNDQLPNNEYIHPSLESENFIHCSEIQQIEGVLSRYFQGQQNLLILTIDPEKLTSSVVYEMAEIGEFFPHIYEPIYCNSLL